MKLCSVTDRDWNFGRGGDNAILARTGDLAVLGFRPGPGLGRVYRKKDKNMMIFESPKNVQYSL